MGLLAAIDAGFGIGHHKLNGLYYDTKKEIRCFVEPDQASVLKTERNYGALSIGAAAVIGSVYIGADVAAGDYVKDLPFMGAFATFGFGKYWRPKQVLDGNWSLLDKAPPEKQTSKVKSAMPGNAMPVKIHNSDMLPTAEL